MFDSKGDIPKYNIEKELGGANGAFIGFDGQSSITIQNFSKQANLKLLEGTKVIARPSTLNPRNISFMQSSIKNYNGDYTVLGNASALRNGTLKPTDLPTIRVWKDKAGKVWTLDHRRLGAYRLAEIEEVPVEWVQQQQMRKMTTTNGGASIRLKLGNRVDMIIE